MAEPGLDFRGLGEFSLSMRKLSDTQNIKREVGGVMAALLLREANKIVPVLTGNLRSSGYMQWFNNTWNVGYATPYAAFQHESFFDRRPPAENQWLLVAAAKNADLLSQRGKEGMEGWLSVILGALSTGQRFKLVMSAGSLLRKTYSIIGHENYDFIKNLFIAPWIRGDIDVG